MATNPMMPPQNMPMQDAETPAEAAAPGEEADTGVELCIKIADDGSISVYKETGEDETAEQSAQPVADIGQALAWCLREYKGLDRQGAESQFDAGFGPQQGSEPPSADKKRMGMWR